MLGVPFILYGGNDAADNVASSDSSQPLVFYTSGRQRVRVAVSPPWESTDKPWAVVGAINWRLKVIPTSQIISINSARLEFYAITKNLPYFYKKVVPVKLLRRFVIPFRDNSTSWVTYCCQQTFANFSFLYDSYNGGAFYARQNTGGSFRLASYLDDIGRQTMLNCYDQASIMQICLGLSPNTNTAGYVYMSNFGWIVTTPLVGRGRTNNPFYLNSQCNHSIICDNNAPNRSRFANHAFVSLKPNDKDKIVDACNGPHNGNGNLQAYITAAIQTMDDTTLYRAQDKKPGTVNDADFKVSGVTNFEGTTATTAVKMATTVTKAIDSPSLPLPGAPRFLEGVEHMINLAKGSGSAIAERRSNAALADFFDDAIVSRQGFSIARSSIAASANGTDAEWVLKSNDGNDDISVSVFLAAGGLLDAIVAFGNHLGTYTRALDGMFREPEDPHSLRGQLNLESVGAGNGEEESKLTLLWVYGNVFVHIAHRSGGPHHNGPRIRELADELHKHISEGAKPLDSDEVVVPRIRKISGPEGPVAVGDTFIVRISLEGKSYTTVDCKAGLAVLMEHNQAEGYFKFYAAESGSETISFNFAHQSTLNSTTRELEVEVKEA
ncbi:hypothetical protein F4859DRAFT_1834 [Xylaria cf. heliscus]|nr:hypothetical protein F4859DRAFT_1834 [Xylaria cf. heliscus]